MEAFSSLTEYAPEVDLRSDSCSDDWSDIMYCLGVLRSGNYAFNLCRILEKKGYYYEVISTPCQIAKNGCGFCIKFPCEDRDVLISEASANGMPVVEVYKATPMFSKNKYEKVY